jgi:hypothetical protein
MAFLKPVYSNDDFKAVRLAGGEEIIIPADDVSEDMETLETFKGKWFYRLSADGFLDCTEWFGPFPTERAAKLSLEANENVCHSCGESMPDDYSTECQECETAFIL